MHFLLDKHRMIEKITVYDNRFTIKFKSSTSIDIVMEFKHLAER